MTKPHLISFDLCPYVQRSVMTLQVKGVEYDITYIDLADKPDWFLQISPFGKVPVLKVGEDVLFESAVINEYLDEVYGEAPLMPADPLVKAKNRAWIEFGGQLLANQYQWSYGDAATSRESLEKLNENLAKLESVLAGTPYFNGTQFSLIDAAYAPFFLRLDILSRLTDTFPLEGCPKVKAWSDSLLAMKETTTSVPEGFEEKFTARLRDKGSTLLAA